MIKCEPRTYYHVVEGESESDNLPVDSSDILEGETVGYDNGPMLTPPEAKLLDDLIKGTRNAALSNFTFVTSVTNILVCFLGMFE